MLLFIPRSLCALKRVAAKAEHARLPATGTNPLYRPKLIQRPSARLSRGAAGQCDIDSSPPHCVGTSARSALANWASERRSIRPKGTSTMT